MMNKENRDQQPSLEDIYEYVHNDLLKSLCLKLKQDYQANEQIDFSQCSWEYGWNVKFKKRGKTLCTIYLREGYFTVLIVVGQKEKEAIEKILPTTSDVILDIYHQTQEGNHQKWLMIDLEDQGQVYEDVLKLIDIRYHS